MIKRFSLAAVALLLAVAAAGCPKKAAVEPVRIGYLQADLHQLAAFVALERGLFAEAGVEVTVAGVFKAGPEEMSAIAAGELDVGYVGAAPATTAVANGAARVRIIAQVNKEGSALVVGKKGTAPAVAKLEDLRGRTVAIPGHATVQDFLLGKALASAGLGRQEVATLVIKPPEMIGALRTGQIDGFIAWEPYVARAVTGGAGRILAPSREIWSHHPCCVLVADTPFVEARPEAVEQILEAHIRATRFIRERPAEATAIGVAYTGMDEETVKTAMANIEFDYRPSRDDALRYVEFLNRLGYTKVPNPGRFADGLVDTAPLARVEERLGANR